MLIGIWDNGNLESIFSRITDRQTNSIHCNRTFVNSKISSFCHFRTECILECKIPAALCVIYSYTSSSLIYMSLNDMPVQTSIHHHTAFYINLISHFQQTNIRTFDSFLHGRNRISSILNTHYSQTNSIMRNTLVYF